MEIENEMQCDMGSMVDKHSTQRLSAHSETFVLIQDTNTQARSKILS